jgi:MoxR-like ATPase
VLGEALAAFEYAEREKIVPLLIVDEIDKCPEGITNMLLQLFGRGWAHVPRVGRIGVENPELMPVVVLTSNDMGRLSGPLRSRCVYTWIESPTAEEEVNILRSRVPGASALAIASVSKITDCLKTIAGIEERPALREEIDLLEAMTREGVDVLTLDNLEEYLCLIAKTQNDRLILLQSLARLEDWASSPNEAIDRWVRATCGDTRSESRLSTFAEAA